jgi:streptomycin 6-kinase
MFDDYLTRWDLVPDGDPICTRAARLLPVRWRGEAAMLRVAIIEEAKDGGVLLRWWDGRGAARVLAMDGDPPFYSSGPRVRVRSRFMPVAAAMTRRQRSFAT